MAIVTPIIYFSTIIVFFFGQLLRIELKGISFPLIDIFIFAIFCLNIFQRIKTKDFKVKNKYLLYFLRFFNKKYGCFTGAVHEIWQSPKEIENKKIHIHHYPHQSLKSFIKKINFYSDIRAQELYDQNQKSSLFQIFFYPLGKFIQNYFFKLGFLDSTPGIIMALGMSFHSFLVRAKLWHLSHQ